MGITIGFIAKIGGAYSYLQQNKDHGKFITALNEFADMEDKAIAPLKDTTLTDPELKNKIDSLCYPLWRQAETKLKATSVYQVSPAMHTKADKLLEYVQLRKQELDIYIKLINTGKSEDLIPQLNEVRNRINSLVAVLQKL